LKPEDDKNKTHFQLIWGVLLVLMGVAFFFQIPQSMHRIKTIESTSLEIGFIYFCLYLIDFGLLLGGVKKIYANLKKLKNDDSSNSQGL
jgi:hypothetical protein